MSGGAWALTGNINDTSSASTPDPGAGSTGPLNILVAGVDPRTGLTHHEEVVLHVGNDVSSNSDTLMLMHVSADRSRVTVVSIPRDSWVNIPGHGMNKINAAYGLGGAKLMVQTVEQATGMTINDYVEVDFLGFVKVIDALGGVNICLPQAVSDSYSGLDLSAGMHHVNGITALAYARDRHSFASSDLARIQDQQRLLSSALTQAIHSGLLANPVRLSSFISASLSALTVDQGMNVSALADQMRGISARDVTFMTVPLASADYQTPTGELAVQWDTQAAGQLFQALANDQNLATPAPSGPSPAAGAAHSSSPPGGSGTASGGSPRGRRAGAARRRQAGPPAAVPAAGRRRRTPADSAFPHRPGRANRRVTIRRSAGVGIRPGWSQGATTGRQLPGAGFAAFRACPSVRDYARVVADLREPVTGLPKRQPASRPTPAHNPAPSREVAPRPSASAGRHRRPVPDGLPPEAPALVLAVAGHAGTPDVAAEITSIVRVDNPSLDVRLARVGASYEDPAGLPAVLASAATIRPADGPAAIVVPLLALPYPAVTDAIRYAVIQSNVTPTSPSRST